MAEFMKIAQMASSVLQVGSSIMGGNSANNSAQSEAQQLEYQAGQHRAASQRQAEEQRRQARLANSRLQAVAGGGGGDVSVVNLAADIAGEGELRALTSIYEGEDRAIGMELQADSRRKAGKGAKSPSMLNTPSVTTKVLPVAFSRRLARLAASLCR